MLLLGCHVGMSGKEMMLGSVKESIEMGANTFMLYTGAPQNTRRKEISELRIEEGQALMKQNGIENFIVHAPYIINLANTIKPETYELAVEFLAKEITRTSAMGSKILVLHPGSHVNAGVEAGINKIVEGLNSVLTAETDVYIALETMAGKGSEIGRNFEELARIFDKVKYNDKLRICFDTCHVSDAGYDIINNFDGVIDELDRLIGKENIAAFHINDSLNAPGAAKDRHANIGFGHIGFKALHYIVHHNAFENVPKILETPYATDHNGTCDSYAPYKYEIAMLKNGVFDSTLLSKIIEDR